MTERLKSVKILVPRVEDPDYLFNEMDYMMLVLRMSLVGFEASVEQGSIPVVSIESGEKLTKEEIATIMEHSYDWHGDAGSVVFFVEKAEIPYAERRTGPRPTDMEL